MSSVADLLRAAINPRAVAVVGASADVGKFGGRVMQFLVKHGYPGRIVPVNPGATCVFGIPAYKSITEVGAAIDVALLALPAQHLPAALEQCGAAEVPCCVIITADFAELGDEGAAREAELVRIARSHDMRLIGPNCLGFINPHVKLALTSSVALAVEPMPKGSVGLVSQSGSMMASMISHAADSGAGFSACVTVGNQADLEICDFIEYFLQDDTTHAICTYIEGLKNGPRFLALAERCREAGKPLLAVKAGSSDAGAHLTRSHTASFAGSHAVWQAAAQSGGVLAIDDPESMIDCAHFLTRFGPARNAGVAALSPSGGTIAVTADRLYGAGLELAELVPATREALSRIVPPTRPLNPLDVGGLPREQGVSAANDAQALLSNDPSVGIVFIVVATTPHLDEKVRKWGETAIASGKPTAILFTPGRLVDSARKTLREIGCPYTDRMDDALRVIRTAVDYGRVVSMRRGEAQPPAFIAVIEKQLSQLPIGRLTEPEAKSLLRAAGLSVTSEVLATNVEDAVAAATRLGYPVVLKAVCRELVHKSDIGAVKLGLLDEDAVRNAWRDVIANVAQHFPRSRMDGCVVQEMAAGGIEVILGARWDPQFGAVVMAGAGGILVEVMSDVALALAPLGPDDARTLLQKLKIWPVLAGTRGRPALDLEALTEALARLSWIAHTAGARLLELDVNPVLVKQHGVVALDARATTGPASS
ncbi:MAG: acetyl-CoA synthetase [Betaproteobacteria bacterium]|jgi:acyl-CoA synthetase (NDP forming)|nr:acetyl-CoA synthetase [Betaproteobacteria bacterium]